MWDKIKESKRALALYIGASNITVLLVVAIIVGPPTVEAGVQATLATGLVSLLTVGVPALMASMGYTDAVEANAEVAKVNGNGHAKEPPAEEPKSPEPPVS